MPTGQRFGPTLPPGTNTLDVFGVGTDRRARLDRLSLDGSVGTPDGRLPLKGLNQYALPVNSVGAFTSRWGTASRVRAVCGTDTQRSAPCSDDTYEVKVRGGRVVSAADAPGSGTIPADTTVLVGREDGAQHLRKLSAGDPGGRHAHPGRRLVGGAVHVRDRRLPGAARRHAAGRPGRRHLGRAHGRGRQGRRPQAAAAGAGRRLRLPVRPHCRGGGGHHAVARATDAFNLDGGGSTEMVTRGTDDTAVTVRNHPSGGAERPRAQRHRGLLGG
ncbi:hypothetical protein GCM10017687_30650 [Streptomyces echinatus]